MRYVLALDQGTTSSRSILFDASGTALAVAQREFRQIFPKPGWVEHDPVEIWSTQAATMTEVLAKAHARPSDVAAIGITNQRETTLLWDRATLQPVANAIVWQDRRTAPRCEELRAQGLEDWIRARTGLVLDPYFSATKLEWLLDHTPGARAAAEAGKLAFGTVDAWLCARLTAGAVHVTDASNASRTLLFDLKRGGFDDELLHRFRVPRAVLPRVCDSIGPIGACAADTPLPGVPIAGILGDQQAALFGQLCLEKGLAKNTYGTGCFLLAHTGDAPVPSRNRLLSTVAWRRAGRTEFALEGSVFTGGSVVQWLRDGLGILERSADVEALAASVPDSQGVVMVPAFTGLGAPQWDPYARGAIFGLTRGTSRAHLARAALDSIAFQVADLADAMAADLGAPLAELRADGGAAGNDLLLQFQADVLQLPVWRPPHLETTALGAALAAGLAVGFWTDPQQLAQRASGGVRFTPARSADDVRVLRARWSEAVRRSLHWERPPA